MSIKPWKMFGLVCVYHVRLIQQLKNGKDIPYDVSHLEHLELMFCAFEKSNCIHENRGCLCEKCPVHKKYALNNEDYCLNTGGIL